MNLLKKPLWSFQNTWCFFLAYNATFSRTVSQLHRSKSPISNSIAWGRWTVCLLHSDRVETDATSQNHSTVTLSANRSNHSLIKAASWNDKSSALTAMIYGRPWPWTDQSQNQVSPPVIFQYFLRWLIPEWKWPPPLRSFYLCVTSIKSDSLNRWMLNLSVCQVTINDLREVGRT